MTQQPPERLTAWLKSAATGAPRIRWGMLATMTSRVWGRRLAVTRPLTNLLLTPPASIQESHWSPTDRHQAARRTARAAILARRFIAPSRAASASAEAALGSSRYRSWKEIREGPSKTGNATVAPTA